MKLTFEQFLKAAEAYSLYAAPAPTPAPAPAPAPTPAPTPAPDAVLKGINDILATLNAAPNPSLSDVKPLGIDDVMAKIFE